MQYHKGFAIIKRSWYRSWILVGTCAGLRGLATSSFTKSLGCDVAGCLSQVRTEMRICHPRC